MNHVDFVYKVGWRKVLVMDGRFGRLSTSSFGKIHLGLAASTNTSSTRPNRYQVLDGKGVEFAVRRVTPAVGWLFYFCIVTI
jgi:hypothetical protein